MRHRSAISWIVAVGFIVAGAALLQAHVVLQKSLPAANAVLTTAPKQIQLSFNEAPDVKVSKMDIKGPSPEIKLITLHVMDKSLMAMVQGDMPDGAYVVTWQAAGDDGHISKGELAFSVKRAK